MILTIASEKGGTGKTTISTNLAVIAALHKNNVLLIDADPQQSALDFIKVREMDNIHPSITCTPIIGKSIHKLLPKFEKDFDIIIVDVGGRDSITMRSAITVSKKLLVPFLPGSFDAWATERMSQLIKLCKESINPTIEIYSSLNKADVNPKNKDNQEMLDLIQTFPNIPTPSSILHYRVAYRRAVAEGKSVIESRGTDADNKAIIEINKLYNKIFEGFKK